MKKSIALVYLALLSSASVIPSVVSATEINQPESNLQVHSEVGQPNFEEDISSSASTAGISVPATVESVAGYLVPNINSSFYVTLSDGRSGHYSDFQTYASRGEYYITDSSGTVVASDKEASQLWKSPLTPGTFMVHYKFSEDIFDSTAPVYTAETTFTTFPSKLDIRNTPESQTIFVGDTINLKNGVESYDSYGNLSQWQITPQLVDSNGNEVSQGWNFGKGDFTPTASGIYTATWKTSDDRIGVSVVKTATITVLDKPIEDKTLLTVAPTKTISLGETFYPLNKELGGSLFDGTPLSTNYYRIKGNTTILNADGTQIPMADNYTFTPSREGVYSIVYSINNQSGEPITAETKLTVVDNHNSENPAPNENIDNTDDSTSVPQVDATATNNDTHEQQSEKQLLSAPRSVEKNLPKTGENERMTLLSVLTGLSLISITFIISAFRFKRLKNNQ